MQVAVRNLDIVLLEAAAALPDLPPHLAASLEAHLKSFLPPHATAAPAPGVYACRKSASACAGRCSLFRTADLHQDQPTFALNVVQSSAAHEGATIPL